MEREKLIYNLFGIPQEKKVHLYLPEIEEKLSEQTEKATIEVREIEWDDPLKKLDNPTYLDDELLKFTETGVKLLYTTDKVVEMLKKHIPRTVKELTISSEFLTDLSFLKEFPNLETLNISDYGVLTKEELDYINKETTIKNMTLRTARTFEEIRCKEGCNIIEAGNIIAQYGKVTMLHRGYSGKWSSNLRAYTSSYDKKNLATLATLYAGISPHIEEVKYAALINRPEAFEQDFYFIISDKKVSNMTAKNVSPTEAARVYKNVHDRTDVASSQISLENRTYEDIYQLKEMNATSKCTIRYNDGASYTDAPYDEFLNMRATIDYYKELIETSNLSPAEKVAYVYDILKTMRYNEHQSDKNRSRKIHSIVTDGAIVCVGYSNFAEQLLKEVGVRSISTSVLCLSPDGDAGHQRNFVRIDDDKYDIHGLYAMDITWDSDRDISVIENEDGTKTVIARPTEEEKSQIVDQYDNLVLYRYFLTPMDQYEQRFTNEENPMLYEAYKNNNTATVVDESRKIASGELKSSEAKNNALLLSQHQQLFDISEGPLTVEKYISAKKPSLETFEEIIRNVRYAQGYTTLEAEQDAERVVELHQMIADQNPNSPNTFFQPTRK